MGYARQRALALESHLLFQSKIPAGILPEKTSEEIVAKIEERRRRLKELDLRDGCKIIVKGSSGSMTGRFDSLDEGTCRVWVRGIDPIRASNPRLCCPLDITVLPGD